MDLSHLLRRWALARPRVLVVEEPGERALRWAAEDELDSRGWPLANSPADTDLLLVLGEPGPELAAAIDVVWQQVSQPRLLLRVRDVVHLESELDAAAGALPDAVEHGEPVVAQTLPETDHSGVDHSGMDHSGTDHGDTGHEGMDHGGMDHGGGHGGMDHHMHHGGSVAGLPMADTGPDRDGLQLDVLGVALGPVLAAWPTGLLVRVSLQGDVVVGAEASWVDGGDVTGPPDADPRRVALDHIARFLLVAGWPTAAHEARRARDGLGSAAPADVSAAERAAVRLARRVSRSRSLSWSVRGVGVVDAEGGAGRRDVLDRVRAWCAVAAGEAEALPEVPVTVLGDLLVGAELAAARLTVASVAVERTPAVARQGMRDG